MRKLTILLVAMALMMTSAYGITCTTDTTKTISLGSSAPISISCSGIGSGVTVTATASYQTTCMTGASSQTTLTQSQSSKQISFTATSMACNANSNLRTITWSYDDGQGSVIPSTTTVVTIQSGLSVSATFLNAPYTATAGSTATISLRVSTGATQDIDSITVDPSGSNAALGLTSQSIPKIAASEGVQSQTVSWSITAPTTTGAYNLQGVVTSQNADSDTATSTLTVSAAPPAPPEDEDEEPPPTPRTPTGVAGASPLTVPLEQQVTAEEKTAVQEDLANKDVQGFVGTFTANELADVVLASAVARRATTVERKYSYDFKGGTTKTKIATSYKVIDDVKTMKVVESIPKTVAATASQITVKTSSGTYKVLEEDPVLGFEFGDVKKGDAITVEYVINKEAVLTALKNFTSTKPMIFAMPKPKAPVTEQPAVQPPPAEEKPPAVTPPAEEKPAAKEVTQAAKEKVEKAGGLAAWVAGLGVAGGIAVVVILLALAILVIYFLKGKPEEKKK